MSSDGKGRFGSLDPYLGAMHAVAEAARNVAVSGAKPLAITNCMNFGNPERPEVMWQFTESIRGMREACLALGTPVTGGNVSFYNETGESAIWPTPVIGMLGLLDDYRLRIPCGVPRGRTGRVPGGRDLRGAGWIGVRRDRAGHRWPGHPPALDLGRERALHDLLFEAARPMCWRAHTIAPKEASRSPSPRQPSAAGTGSRCPCSRICRRMSLCSVSPRRVRLSAWCRGARTRSANSRPRTAWRARVSARPVDRVRCSTGCSSPPSRSSGTRTKALSPARSARSA